MIESRDWVIESKHQVSVRKRTNHSREWSFIWLRIEPDEFGAHCFEGVGWRLSYEGHTVDALALRGEEGRSRLRKALASCQTNCDPEMSEWGNPAVR